MIRRDTYGLGRVTQINHIEMHKGDKDVPMDYKETKKVTTKMQNKHKGT